MCSLPQLNVYNQGLVVSMARCSPLNLPIHFFPFPKSSFHDYACIRPLYGSLSGPPLRSLCHAELDLSKQRADILVDLSSQRPCTVNPDLPPGDMPANL